MKNVTARIAALPPEKQTMLLQRLKKTVVPQPLAVSFLAQTSSDPWVIRYRQNAQACLRLFCFSYAGGGASVFRSWADFLPRDVEVCAIQLPGREYRIGEPAYRRLVPLVQDLSDAILPHLDRPFAFFGHSMGALVSFELARHLRRTQKRQPVLGAASLLRYARRHGV